jgi:hypothetical protein
LSASAWPGPPGHGQLAAAGAVRDGRGPEQARDVVWTLISPEVTRLLVEGRGWSPDQCQAWLATLADALSGRSRRAGGPREPLPSSNLHLSLPPTWPGQDAGRQVASTTR